MRSLSGWISDHLLRHRILSDLEEAGFSEADCMAVENTSCMWEQVSLFYRQGGRVVTLRDGFSAASGAPDQITIYRPEDPADCIHSTYATLAHELGHALQEPDQWRPPGDFATADAYAHARELGEAHAWLNEYLLCIARADDAPMPRLELHIENREDFGTHVVEPFSLIVQWHHEGASNAVILERLAELNSHMFPSGMGPGNHKTYGQCNRWDYLMATGHHEVLDSFSAAMGRAPLPDEQKVLMKFHLQGNCVQGPIVPALFETVYQVYPDGRPEALLGAAAAPAPAHGAPAQPAASATM